MVSGGIVTIPPASSKGARLKGEGSVHMIDIDRKSRHESATTAQQTGARAIRQLVPVSDMELVEALRRKGRGGLEWEVRMGGRQD